MGYSDSKTEVMIGIGVSSISDSWNAFAQNEKSVEAYYKLLAENKLPVIKGHLLNAEDLEIRRHILNLMCHNKTEWDSTSRLDWDVILERMSELIKDGLVSVENHQICIEKNGHAFVRNICMCLDLRLRRKQPKSQVFSQTI